MLGATGCYHGVVATGRGALKLRSLIATLRGLISHGSRANLHSNLYNDPKNIGFFENYAKQTSLILLNQHA